MITQNIIFKVTQATLRNKRNIGIAAPALAKVSDPIQKLFLDKIKEYKSKSSDGKMVDPNPEIQKEMKNELERVAKQYGGGEGVDMTSFPKFNFVDPQIDIGGTPEK